MLPSLLALLVPKRTRTTRTPGHLPVAPHRPLIPELPPEVLMRLK